MFTVSLTSPNYKKAALISISVAVMMAGCGQKDKGLTPLNSAQSASLGLSKADDKVFAKYFELPKRDISESDGQNALNALGLNASDDTGLSWKSQSGDKGNYSFTDLKSGTEAESIDIGTAKFYGVRMEGEIASFDRADFLDLTIKSEDITLETDALSIARPSPDTAKAIMQSLKDIAKNDIDLDFGDEAEFGFGALSVNNVTIKSDELDGNLEQLIWGIDEDTDLLDAKIENIALDVINVNPFRGEQNKTTIGLKSASLLGYNKAAFQQAYKPGNDNASILQSFSNLYDKMFDSYYIDSVTVKSPNVDIESGKIEGQAVTKGAITTTTQNIEPMVMTLHNTDPDSPAFTAITEVGLDKITIKGSQVTILDSGNKTVTLDKGVLEMVDRFKMNFTGKASNLPDPVNIDGKSEEEVNSETFAALSDMTLNRLTLSLEDQSIVERGLGLAASMTGKNVNALKREMRAAMVLAPIAAPNEISKDILGQLSGAFMDFIDEGGVLTIEMAPETPLALSKLEDIDALNAEDLGFKAQHNSLP